MENLKVIFTSNCKESGVTFIPQKFKSYIIGNMSSKNKQQVVISKYKG